MHLNQSKPNHQFISNIQNSLGNGSGWNIESVIEYNLSISKYNPLAGSSYIK